MKGVEKDSYPEHDYSLCISSDLGTEAQPSQNNEGSLSPIQSRAQAVA